MYLPKPEKNKYSVGKYLRTQKRLRKLDSQAKVIQMPTQLKQYTEQLKLNGMQFKNLDYAIFYTKNGLPYPGLIAKEKILSNTIMLRVPLQCLLNTRIAFFTEIQIIFQQNPKFFSKKFTADWEDHILLAFILFQHQKGRQSKWYNLIRNLPRDIDYAVFWSQKQLQVMEDKWMQLGISQQRQTFQEQCKEFTQICQKYPRFFQKQTFCVNNIRWIQSHLVTRCFGKYFQYTTMVPFAELLNHQCVDVYYSMDYKPGNPHTQNQQFYEEKHLTQQQELEIQTSDGSYDAEDFYEDEEFFQASLTKQSQQPSSAFAQHPNISIDKDIKSIKSYMLTFICFNDSVSLSFLIQIFRQLQQISQLQISTQQEHFQAKQKLRQIHSLNVRYVKAVKQYYSQVKSQMYVYGVKQKKKKQNKKLESVQPQIKAGQGYFNTQWPQDKFDDFVMLCSTKDQFQEGSQVYFCYGRLPNKLLLLRYGISLQNNKYNHLFLRVNIQQRVKQSRSLSLVVEYQVNMSKYKRFKVKLTTLCIELLTYLRAQRWVYPQTVENIFMVKDLRSQLQILSQASQMYMKELGEYRQSLQKNKERLFDKGLNYHEYFCLIYKIQNQQILTWQLKMIDYAGQVFRRHIQSNQKSTVREILLQETDAQKLMMQTMMEAYFKSCTRSKE